MKCKNCFFNPFQNGESSGKLERKDVKELQELADKLIYACAKIAGSYIEQTAWIRKNFVVNSELQEETNGELQSGTYLKTCFNKVHSIFDLRKTQ